MIPKEGPHKQKALGSDSLEVVSHEAIKACQVRMKRINLGLLLELI